MSVIEAIKNAARPAALAITLATIGPAAYAQQPSPAAMSTAKELITVTGATGLFSPLIAGVVEQAKILYLQQDPSLAKDLNEITAQMRTDLQPRFSELTDEVARLYATNFSEQELKEILAFYKTPLRQETVDRAVEDCRFEHEICAGLGEQAFRSGGRKNARRTEEARPRALRDQCARSASGPH